MTWCGIQASTHYGSQTQNGHARGRIACATALLLGGSRPVALAFVTANTQSAGAAGGRAGIHQIYGVRTVQANGRAIPSRSGLVTSWPEAARDKKKHNKCVSNLKRRHPALVTNDGGDDLQRPARGVPAKSTDAIHGKRAQLTVRHERSSRGKGGSCSVDSSHCRMSGLALRRSHVASCCAPSE